MNLFKQLNYMPKIRSILKRARSEPIIPSARMEPQAKKPPHRVTWASDLQGLHSAAMTSQKIMEPLLLTAYILVLVMLLHWVVKLILDFVMSFLFSYFLLATGLVLYIIYQVIVGNEEYWSKRGVPYLKNGYLTGYLTGKQSETVLDIYRKFSGEKYGGLFFFNRPVLIVRDPELINLILVKNFPYFQHRNIPDIKHEPLAANLFSLQGQMWQDMRYKLLTTFTADKLERIYGELSSCGTDMMDKLEEIPKDNNEVEFKSIVFDYTLETISKCALGIQFTPFRFQTFKTIVEQVFTTSPLQILRFIIIIFLPKLAEFFNVRLFSREICDYFINLIKTNLKFRKDSKIRRNDYFQQLVNLHEKEELKKAKGTCVIIVDGDTVINQMHHTEENTALFSEDTVCANSFSFLVSTKSVSATISHILLELSRHPDIQEKLQQEVNAALTRHKGCSYSALQEMPYLDQIIQEVQRMYPVFPMLMRECTKPFKVPQSNLTIEKGVLVMIPVVALHHDPYHYTDPHLFNPDRFAGNNYMPSSIYLPYGNGPRICIAMRFALLQMKTCVARVISQYKLKLGSKTKKFADGPSAKNGLWLVLEKRESANFEDSTMNQSVVL